MNFESRTIRIGDHVKLFGVGTTTERVDFIEASTNMREPIYVCFMNLGGRDSRRLRAVFKMIRYGDL